MANHVACVGRARIASDYVGSGKEERWGGLDVYVAGSESATSAVIFASDVFGSALLSKKSSQLQEDFTKFYPKYNALMHQCTIVVCMSFCANYNFILRKLADWMGARGFFVVVPDFFHGDPILPDMDPVLRDTWFVRHDASLSLGEAEGLVEALGGRGFTKVTAAGFCWGASLVVKMKGVRAIVVAHPAKITLDDIAGVATPFAVLIGDHDEVTSLDMVEEWRPILEAKPELQGKLLIKVFQNCAHGFLARPATPIEEAAAHEARQDMASFINQFTA